MLLKPSEELELDGHELEDDELEEEEAGGGGGELEEELDELLGARELLGTGIDFPFLG